MPYVHGPLMFDAQAPMQQVQDNAWADTVGDLVIVDFISLQPNLPASLDDLDELRRRTAAHAASSGAGLVELDVIGLDGLPAIRQIVKLPLPDRQHGVVYIGSFTVPKTGCSVVLRVQCAERGVTGERDAAVLDRFMRQRQGAELPQIMAEWARHPYDPAIQGGLPRNESDDPAWDAQFPDHPLSRARAGLGALAPTIRFDPRFKELPRFTCPQA